MGGVARRVRKAVRKATRFVDKKVVEPLIEKPIKKIGKEKIILIFFHRFRFQNHKKIDPNTSPDGPWWLRGAICLAMRAPGEPLGAVGVSSGAKKGAQESPNKKF